MLVTSIEITNHSNTIVSFKGLNFYILIQANQSGLECNIPADNALQNIAKHCKTEEGCPVFGCYCAGNR